MADFPVDAKTFTQPHFDDLPQRSLYKIAQMLSGGFGQFSPKPGDNEQVLLFKVASILSAAQATI